MSKVAWHVCIIAVLACTFMYSPSRAIAQIAPTNTATISGSVQASNGSPVIDASVAINGPKHATTRTDARGNFVFVGVPFGTYEISATASNFETVTRQVVVTEDINVAIQYVRATNQLKTIAHVATAENARFNVTPASLTYVSPASHAVDGQTSWRKILEQIPGVSVTGNSSTIFSVFPDSPFVPAQISINGALPYETATLLDDMPLISSSFISDAGTGTNIGLYPLNAFNAADIVRGPGANAPSIVDSIGGSFVLHAPGQVSQNHYVVSLSNDPYGGIVANAIAAVRWNKLSAVVSYGVNDSPGPLGNSYGVVPNEDVPLTVDGNTFICSGACSLNPVFASGYQPYTGAIGYESGLLICCSSLNSYWNQHSGSVGLTYQFSRALTAQIYYAGQAAEIHFFQPGWQVDFMPPSGYSGSIPAGTSILTVGSAIYPNAPDHQASSLLEEKITAQIGLGVLKLAALQNRVWNDISDTGFGTQTGQLYGGGEYCNDPACSSTTPVVFNGETHTMTFSQINLLQENPSNNRDMLVSYATPLGKSFQAGVSFVKSYYNTPDYFFFSEPAYSFSLSCPTPSDISQSTNETRIFISDNPSDRTSLALSWYAVGATYHLQDPNNPAAYTDSVFHYNAPRLGFVWRPTATVAIRASAGGGFAEAPLSDLIGTNTPFCFGGTCTVAQPNLNLLPEKSFGFDVGTDIRLNHDTAVSLDVYRSRLYGQIYQYTTLDGTYLGEPLYSTSYGNLGESRYEGILVDLRHTVASHGYMWSLAAGLTRGYVVSVPAGFYDGITCPPPNYIATLTPNSANLEVVPNVNFNGEFAGVVPYAQATGTLGYQWTTEKYIDVIGTYYGNNNSYYRPAFMEFDGDVAYPLTHYASVLLTFRNITGVFDRAVGLIAPANLVGFPSVSGPPFGSIAQYYGPRTVILTLQFHP